MTNNRSLLLITFGHHANAFEVNLGEVFVFKQSFTKPN